MKYFIRTWPELAGLLLGVLDVFPRLLAAALFAPRQGQLHGAMLIGNIPHPNETMAFGLGTQAWFAIAAGVLAVMYAGTRLAEHLAEASNTGFRAARFFLGCVGGVLALNVAESLATGRVTDYIGLANGARFTAVNLGDLLLWFSLCGFLPAMAVALALYFGARERARCG